MCNPPSTCNLMVPSKKCLASKGLLRPLFHGFMTSCVVYFDQLLGAAHTQKLVETFFFSRFSTFFENQPKTDNVPPQGVDSLLHVDQL